MVQRTSPNEWRYSRHFIVFSVILFLIILVVSSTALLLSMRKIVQNNKGIEMVRILELERHILEAEFHSDIAIVLKMASCPIIQQHFLAPDNVEIAEVALKDIEGYGKMLTSASLFWVKDNDKKLFFEGKETFLVDTENPELYWYNLTMYETELYNFNINYNPSLKVTNIWINAPVRGPDGKPLGIVGMGINLPDFVKTIYQNYKGNAELYYFNALGEITGSRNLEQIIAKEHIDQTFGNGFFARAQKLQPGETCTFDSPIGKSAIGTVPSLNWYSAAVMPDSIDDYMNHVTAVFLVMLAVVALILIIFNVFIAIFLKSIRTMMDSLEAASRHKSDFLALISHEIRTPMNAILGITEIQLQDKQIAHDFRNAFEKIYTSGDMLLGIVNDILDLSKIEAGKLELIVAPYQVASLVSETAQLNMMRISSKPIEFTIHVANDVPAYLSGDELRVKQILNNLLSNAFKYTTVGMVELSVATETIKSCEDMVTLIITVSDTGQGMRKEHIEKLFDRYTRFNMGANRLTEGTGLGMSITSNLIRLMNGEIHIASEPEKGSMFTVCLPQGKVGGEILGKETVESLQPFHANGGTRLKRVQITREPMPYGSVLIVDDVATNIYVAKGLLLPYELQLDTADSGKMAIDKIKAGNRYDVIFMDHMMPKMDGLEATKIIRSLGYDRPIVALTANAVSGQADMFLENGFDDFVSKPIDTRQLNAVLNRFVRDKKRSGVIQTSSKSAEKEKQSSANELKSTLDPLLVELIVRDASKVLAVLEPFIAKNDYGNQENLQTYILNVHGIKSVLVAVGNTDLSAAAKKLEMAAQEGNLELLASETPAFVDALRAFVSELVR